MPSLTHKEVPVKKLRWQCAPKSLGFKTTDEISGCDEIIGQDRALRAIKLGLEVKSPGYNIYVAGLTGTGKTTTIKHLLESIDTQGDIPDDLCYVYNFSHPDTPKVLRLANGNGCTFAKDMKELLEELKTKLQQIFESEEFEKRGKKVLDDMKKSSLALFKKLEKKMQQEGFALVKVEMGSVSRPEIVPVVDDKIVPWDQLSAKIGEGKLSDAEFKKLVKKHESLSEDLEKAVRESRVIEKQVQGAFKDLKHQFCLPVVKSLISELKYKYLADTVVKYLDKVQDHILQNLDTFKEKDENAPSAVLFGVPSPASTENFLEYKVNVVVDNSKLDKVPVIIETAPNYKNLFGTIERVWDRSGIAHTDFTKIKAGSLLKANGGYLVFNLLDSMVEPGVWVALKRTLKNRKLDIQSHDPFNAYSNFALKPEPVDVDIKVVVIGDAHLYQMLYAYDEDFRKIFKVKADFDSTMAKNATAIQNYAKFVKKICDDEELMPFSDSGVAEVIEYGVRLAGRQNKISTRFSDIADLMREAQYWAKQDESSAVSDVHVQKAISEKHYRSKMFEDKIQEMIEEGVLMIEIEGKEVGQVNGLSVYNLGDYSFGRPSKITAEVSMGQAGIINIEREADLSGKTHNKGVLIIGGYFRGKYAQDKPLSMSASVAFEQSYSGVDGDSASSTEIYAILSELSGLPLRQDIAVTGSVNQKGEIQPIGGVNQKIEGFFEVCKFKGLTGQQGVMIPHQNVDDLMLKPEVVEAAEAGKFHIYPVKRIDDGIEILTGFPAGKKDGHGNYPKGNVNYRVDMRLNELAEGLKTFFWAGETRQSGLVDDHNQIQ